MTKKKHKNGAATTSRVLKAKDLIKLATRCDPSTPVVLLTISGAEPALHSETTGMGVLEIEGEEVECIIISALEEGA